jgi:hypothetical protein
MSIQLRQTIEGVCECPCILPGGSCKLKFQYTNSNQVQDDGFNFYIISPNGTERFIGNINAHCKVNLSECDCAEVDVFSFETTIIQKELSACGPCSIQWRSQLVQDNGCGTFGFFEIIGPYGNVPDAGEIGGSGIIDLRDACIHS